MQDCEFSEGMCKLMKDGRLKNTHPFRTDTPDKLKRSTMGKNYIAMVHEEKRRRKEVMEEEKVEMFMVPPYRI